MQMQKHLIIVAIVSLAATSMAAADEPQEVIFAAKTFGDFGNVVHVEGTLTGDGIGYKNNHTVLTCYQEKRECSAIQIDSKGLQVFSVNLPLPYAIRVWTAERIMADGQLPCGGFESWIVDRTRQTAELIEHPCSDSHTYHWTIEDPPFWVNFKERTGVGKPSR